MAALPNLDLIRALQAPLNLLSPREPERGHGPNRTVLVATWAYGHDNRLTCRWRQETSPPD